MLLIGALAIPMRVRFEGIQFSVIADSVFNGAKLKCESGCSTWNQRSGWPTAGTHTECQVQNL